MNFIKSRDFFRYTPTVKDWLVVGWFTPSYEQIAAQFARQLEERGIPYHLYAVEDFGAAFTERTRAKPTIVLHAMDEWPGRTLILMDVDCIVNGDIAPLLEGIDDVGVVMKIRQAPPPRISLAASSRVMVFRPTLSARRFAESWESLCKEPKDPSHDDELCLAWTFVLRSDVNCRHIPIEYSGRGVGECANQVIAHRSENARRTRQPLSVRRLMKSVEKRFFRSGKSAAWKAAYDRQVTDRVP